MSQDFFAASYATGTDSWSSLPFLPDILTALSVVPKGSLILDMGCGRGKTTIALAQSGYRMVGIDTIPAIVSRATKSAEDQGYSSQVRFVQASATNTGFTDNSFDAIIELGLTQHLDPQTRKDVSRESYRILKPQGHLVSVALSRETQQFLDYKPNLSSDGDFERFGLYYHFYTAEEVRSLFEPLTCMSQYIAHYTTNAYGAQSLSFIYSIFEKRDLSVLGSRETPLSPSTHDVHSSIFSS
jgi:ubiquinone/menaquinone biosynthesis C-methylase UbiE